MTPDRVNVSFLACLSFCWEFMMQNGYTCSCISFPTKVVHITCHMIDFWGTDSNLSFIHVVDGKILPWTVNNALNFSPFLTQTIRKLQKTWKKLHVLINRQVASFDKNINKKHWRIQYCCAFDTLGLGMKCNNLKSFWSPFYQKLSHKTEYHNRKLHLFTHGSQTREYRHRRPEIKWDVGKHP